MEERYYYLAFSLVPGIGPKRFKGLLEYFKTAEKAWKSSSTLLKKAGIPYFAIKNFEQSKANFDIETYRKELRHKKVSFIALCDREYPELLKKIPNPPIVLFVKGDIRGIDFENTIGIVGTRKMTNYGGEVTKLFSIGLSLFGFTVVSGLAMGVDASAAWGAIEAKGKTIAVLGNGVDICAPSSNENLYDKILERNGVIISEFPLGFSPTKGSFPSRNRIIAGLSLGVLVTEGAEDSGSLITADYAFKFNRKVFAVPGPITSSLSVAPLKLIEKGAKLVTDANDIIKELGIKNHELRVHNSGFKLHNSCKMGNQNPKLDKEEKRVLYLLQNEPLQFDEIVRKLKMDSSKVGSLLSLMELKGFIKTAEEGEYKISN